MVGPVLSACARAQQWQQAMALLKLTKSPGPIAFNSLVTRLHLRVLDKGHFPPFGTHRSRQMLAKGLEIGSNQ